MIKEFLDKYDPLGDLVFSSLMYRPRASFSTPFGLDNTFTNLRIHPAIDRGYSPSSSYEIYSPFDMEYTVYASSYWSFGTMTFLTVANADFDMRIAHIGPNDFKEFIKGSLTEKNKKPLKRNVYFADAGNIGTSSGPEIVPGKAGAHTHTELVSRGEKSSILDYILLKKAGDTAFVKPYTFDDVDAFAVKHGAKPELFRTQYEAELKKRNISFLNQYRCVRKDYHTGFTKTFYNSQVIFGF